MLKDFWYVAMRSADLTDQPVGRSICGRSLAFFGDRDGKPAAVRNVCSHRRSPLALGAVIDGILRCPYHGLGFDAAGRCVDIPSQAAIPAQASIPACPVVERYGLIWVWPGDSARADITDLPDMPWRESAGWNTETIQYFPVRAGAALMTDNLLDLSHVAFIHARTIGFDPSRLRNDPLVTEVIGDRVRNTRQFAGVVPPPAHRQWHDFAGLVDRTSISEWRPPGFVFILVRNDDSQVRLELRFDHLITPETATTHHYFIAIARNFKPDDAALTHQLDLENDAVHREDVDIVEAQQRTILENPDLPEVLLRQDQGIVAAQRILAGLALP